MNKKDFNICINLNFSSLNISAFNKQDNKNVFSKNYNFKESIDNDEIDFQEIKLFFQNEIFKIEKMMDYFLDDIYLMIDTEKSFSINLSLINDLDNRLLDKKDVLYLVENAKQQISASYFDLKIIHILITDYVIDKVNYDYLPKNINCKKLSLNIKFICMPKKLIINLEKIFIKNQLSIKRIICTRYVKSIFNEDDNICNSGMKIINGFNLNEVIMVPKKRQTKGFFEHLFHLFR